MSMKKVDLYLTRLFENDIQTGGFLSVFSFERTKMLFSCKTLELPWKENKEDMSRIFTGIYTWKKYYSNHFKTIVLRLNDVPGRSMIEIHYGNFIDTVKKQSDGCILVGEEFRDINHDGFKDVTNSKETLIKLVSLLPDSGLIYINNIAK